MTNTAATMRVADSVRAQMALRNVTQMQLAECLGTSQASVSRHLRGLSSFDIEEIVAYAAALEVPVSVLTDGLDTALDGAA